jgi:hypothetical protein
MKANKLKKSKKKIHIYPIQELIKKDYEKTLKESLNDIANLSTRAEMWEKEKICQEERQRIIEMVKENTNKNIYRDGETAFDIVKDIEEL